MQNPVKHIERNKQKKPHTDTLTHSAEMYATIDYKQCMIFLNNCTTTDQTKVNKMEPQ